MNVFPTRVGVDRRAEPALSSIEKAIGNRGYGNRGYGIVLRVVGVEHLVFQSEDGQAITHKVLIFTEAVDDRAETREKFFTWSSQ